MSLWKCVLFSLAVGAALPAQAQSPVVIDPWFVHVGVARMTPDDALSARVAGNPLPGAAVRVTTRYSAAVEIGRYIAPTLAFSASAGVPIRQPIIGSGTLQPYGRLGRVTHGPAAVTLHWHPLPMAVVRPYVGAGVAYFHVFNSSAGTLQGFRLRDDLGPVVQGGAEVMLGRKLGLFLDAKKGWLTSAATGSVATLPVTGQLRFDPLILHAGLVARF